MADHGPKVSAARASSGPLTRDVLGFLAFSHGWTWAFWALASLAGGSVWEAPGRYLFLVGGAGVMIGGVVMTRVSGGPAALRELGPRLVDPRRVSPRWWAVTLLLFPLLTLLAGGLAALVGSAGPPLDLGRAAARAVDPMGLMALIGFILVIGPLPEEIGWRGYLQDRLQERWSALYASLAVGLVWWSWHLPLFLMPGFFDVFEIARPTPLGFLAGLLPAAVLYAWVYNGTRRSVLAVIMLHFMHNFSGELLGMSAAARVAQVVLMALGAVLVVWWWESRSLRAIITRL
ncbi:MAG: CPBP family intramembrane glutamic endopeptidase [Gemmatimonadota bacterium]